MKIAVKFADVNEDPEALDKIESECWTYENAEANTVACTLTSTDPDIRAMPNAQLHTYTKTGGAGVDLYDIMNSPSTVARSGPNVGKALGSSIVLIGDLDFEATASYTLNLLVTDSGFQQPFGLTATTTLTINVRDVNEAPSFVQNNLDIVREVRECTSLTVPPNSVAKGCE